MNELYSNQQYISLLKLTIAKMRLLYEKVNKCEDEEQRGYLQRAILPYEVLLDYLLHCKKTFGKKLD